MTYTFTAFGIVALENRAAEKATYDIVIGSEEEGDRLDDQDLKDKGVAVSAEPSSYIEDVKKMPYTFWVVCLIITFFYNLVFPWQAIAVNFIKSSYGDHSNEYVILC